MRIEPTQLLEQQRRILSWYNYHDEKVLVLTIANAGDTLQAVYPDDASIFEATEPQYVVNDVIHLARTGFLIQVSHGETVESVTYTYKPTRMIQRALDQLKAGGWA